MAGVVWKMAGRKRGKMAGRTSGEDGGKNDVAKMAGRNVKRL